MRPGENRRNLVATKCEHWRSIGEECPRNRRDALHRRRQRSGSRAEPSGAARVSAPAPSLHFAIYAGEQCPTRCNSYDVSLQPRSALFPSLGLGQQRANVFRVRRRFREHSAKCRIKAKSCPKILVHVGLTTRRLGLGRRQPVRGKLPTSRRAETARKLHAKSEWHGARV